MVAPIILYGSATLRKHSSEVTETDDIRSISETLSDTLRQADGIGLAGPQINILKRVFVINTSPLIENDITIEKFEGTFVNPEIIDISDDRDVYKEGCLSLPDIFEDVYRPGHLLVRYQDLSFNLVEKELEGIVARIFQHEYDHLEGILFIDKINILRRKLLTGKLNKIKKSEKHIN
jgi:peptide deformylase